MSNSTQITTDLFEAIQTITEASLTNLKYDKTSLCTIIEPINQFRYRVQDGHMTFEAIYDGTDKYKKGDSVYVTIPNGDYGESFKRIIGKEKHSKEENKILYYKSPLDSMVDYVRIDDIQLSDSEKIELQWERNEENKYYIDLSFLPAIEGKTHIIKVFYVNGIDINNLPNFGYEYRIDEIGKFIEFSFLKTTPNILEFENTDIFNKLKPPEYGTKYSIVEHTKYNQTKNFSRLGLSFRVKATPNPFIEEYGIRVLVYDGQGNKEQVESIISSKNFLGNPLNYFTFQTQEEVFALNAAAVEFVPYVKEYGADTRRDLTLSEKNDIIFKNIKMFLGFPQEDFSTEEINKLTILSSGPLDYLYEENKQDQFYHLQGTWIRQDEKTGLYYREENYPTEIHEPFHKALSEDFHKTIKYSYVWTTYRATNDNPNDTTWKQLAPPTESETFFGDGENQENAIRAYNTSKPMELDYNFSVPLEQHRIKLQVIKQEIQLMDSDPIIKAFSEEYDKLIRAYSLNEIAEEEYTEKLDNLILNTEGQLNTIGLNDTTDTIVEETQIIFELSKDSNVVPIKNDEGTISLEDKKYGGKYYIYSTTGAAVTSVNTVYLNFLPGSGRTLNQGDYEEQVVWYIPKIDTMLKLPDEYLDMWDPSEEDNNLYMVETNETIETVPMGDEWSIIDSGDWYIEGYTAIIAHTENTSRCPIQFKNFYDSANTNNTVLCRIYRRLKGVELWEGNPVKTQFSAFSFGYYNASNTKYALSLTPVDLPYVLLRDKNEKSQGMKLQAKVTLQGIEIDDSLLSYKWEIIDGSYHTKNSTALQFIINKLDNNNTIFIQPPNQADINSYIGSDNTKLRDIAAAKKIKCTVSIKDTSGNTMVLTQSFGIPSFYLTDAEAVFNEEEVFEGQIKYQVTSGEEVQTYLETIKDISGPTKIVYNYLGTNPSYSRDQYIFYSKNKYIQVENQEVQLNDTINIIYPNNIIIFYDYIEQGINSRYWYKAQYWHKNKIYYLNAAGVLKEDVTPAEYITPINGLGIRLTNVNSDGQVLDYNDSTLEVAQQYSSDVEYTVQLSTRYYTWMQPIIVEKEIYTNSAFIGWNGETNIKEDYILTAMVSAGKMENTNSGLGFSGVMMGEILTPENKKLEGIFGHKQGEEIFRLTTDGEIFIGKKTLNNNDSYLHFDTTNSALDIRANQFFVGYQTGLEDISNIPEGFQSLSWFGGIQTGTSSYIKGDSEALALISAIVDDEGFATKGVGITNFSNWYGDANSSGDPIIWAGYTGLGATPWDHSVLQKRQENSNVTKSWRFYCPFYVTNKGYVQIGIPGGEQGCLTYNPSANNGAGKLEITASIVDIQASDNFYFGERKDGGNPSYNGAYIAGGNGDLVIQGGSCFSLDSYNDKVIVNGDITATTGKIGPWKITSSELFNTSNGCTASIKPSQIEIQYMRDGSNSRIGFNTSGLYIGYISSAGSFHTLYNNYKFNLGHGPNGSIIEYNGNYLRLASSDVWTSSLFEVTMNQNTRYMYVGFSGNNIGKLSKTNLTFGYTNTNTYCQMQGTFTGNPVFTGGPKFNKIIGNDGNLQIYGDDDSTNSGASIQLSRYSGDGCWLKYIVADKSNIVSLISGNKHSIGLGIHTKTVKDTISWQYGVLMELDSSKIKGNLYGTWTPPNWSSDARVKHSIESLPEQYETLFDNLKPTRYKYNNGTSNRYHTGFIAQEVLEAVEKANLSTQDFAAMYLTTREDSGLGDEPIWVLRRDEFIALNTNEIQKLKKRVNQLESEVSSLKEQLLNINN